MEPTGGRTEPNGRPGVRWGADFVPERLALLESRMWKAYYRGQPARLFGTLVLALREQAAISLPRAVYAAALLTKGSCWLRSMERRLDRFAPGVARGYRALGLPGSVDLGIVAREERVMRREIGLAAGTCPSGPSARPAACAAWLLRFEIAARPRIRMARRAKVERTDPKWPSSCVIPTAA
jgi:hypothetical protein